MPIICLTLADTKVVESELDPSKGTPAATKFKIGTLDSRVIGKLKDQSTSIGVGAAVMANGSNDPDAEVDLQVDQNDMFFKACQFGIRGWSNLQDKDGNEVRYETYKRNVGGKSYDIVKDEILSLIPQPVIAEIGRKIVDINEVTAAEEKKSGGAS